MALYKFRGIAKWAKVQQPDDKFDRFTLDLFMDDPSWKLYKDSGIQLKVREGEVEDFNKNEIKGEYVSFARPNKKLVKNEIKVFGKPKVTLNGKDFDGLVGNGSRVYITVSVYDTMKGPGSRLESVDVLDLVEYKNAEVHEPDLPAEGDNKANANAKAEPRAKKNDLDDEIPF